MVTQAGRWQRIEGTPNGLVRERDTGVFYLRRNFSLGGGATKQVLRSLKTKDRAEAVRRFAVESGATQRAIEAARRDDEGRRQAGPASTEEAARYWRELLAATDTDHHGAFDAELEDRLGDPVGTERDQDGELHPVYAPEREAAAIRLAGLVRGDIVPVTDRRDDFLASKNISVRYVSKFKRSTNLLAEWLVTRPETDNAVTVSEKTASDFAAHLAARGMAGKTQQSLLGALGVYWQWLKVQGVVTANVWSTVKRPRTDDTDDKRPFTDEEMITLFNGSPDQTVGDLMKIAALSGMRLNEIARLTVADCAGREMHIRKSKSKAGRRRVPIHPDLVDIIARRTEGKADDAFLFDEMKSSPSRGDGRGDKTGERFTAYRRALRVDDRPNGERQSRVDFHSFRRWFATKAEQADQPPHLISAVLGHELARGGMTLGRYSAGPSVAQLRAVVESVSLPSATSKDADASDSTDHGSDEGGRGG